MKRYLMGVLIALIICMPAFNVFAASSTTDVTALEAQLGAARAYLAHITRKAPYTRLSHDQMRDAALSGTEWLLNAQEESGHFRYEYVPYDDEYLNDDNIVRQGGALFALGEVYRKQDNKDRDIEAGITRAVSYFDNMSIEGRDDGKTFRCVANTPKSSTCKLGATSLVLTGLLGYVEGKPEALATYRALITDYTEYILASQKETGGFRHEYRKTSGFGDEESPYSNGEAMLALVRAYQVREDARVKQSLDAVFNYLKQKEYESPLYLWITAALKDMNVLWPKSEYVTYTRDFTTWRLKGAPYETKDRNYCAYIEGVVSAYSILAAAPVAGELPLLRAEIDKWNSYHTTLQLDSSDMYRVIPNKEGGLYIGRMDSETRAEGGFLTAHSNPTQRIDFTQHCVSAYIQTLVDIDKQTI